MKGAGGALIGVAPSQGPAIRVESIPVAGGAQLTTLFAEPERATIGGEIPVVSFLRDDLGDDDSSDGGRLRQIWILTYRRPSVLQRISAVLPFPLWHRTKVSNSVKPPKPILDATAPYPRAIAAAVGVAFRSELINPNGFSARAPALSYEGNISEYRRVHLFEALSALQQFGSEPGVSESIPRDTLQRLESRLALSDRSFGGLVSERKLIEFHHRDRTQLTETRGSNWDLLRQKAEADGLYFQPVGLPGFEAAEALLWISTDDLAADRARTATRPFDGKLLSISNPWTDSRLWDWTGYSEIWYLDAEGRRAEPGSNGAHSVRMIPLAFYSLDHRHSPLLLVDFRDTSRVKRDEVGRRLVEDVPRAVLGFALLGNWQYHLADAVWGFVRGRHGAAVDRSFRTQAYAEARWHLLLGSGLNPALEDELGRRLDALSLNPIRETQQTETQIAREQFAALVAYAESPKGLPERLSRDRRAEMTRLVHRRPARTLLATANIATLGLYHHREASNPALLALLEEHRRLEDNMQFVRQALTSSPRVEVATNMEKLRRAVRDLSASTSDSAAERARLLGRLVLQTGDVEARAEFLAALHRMDDAFSAREMARLSQDPGLPAQLRATCRDYLLSRAEQAAACSANCATDPAPDDAVATSSVDSLTEGH